MLKNIDIEYMYNLRVDGMTLAELAEKFSCSITFVWKSIRDYCSENDLPLPKKRSFKIVIDVDEAYILHDLFGWTYSKLAKKYGVSRKTLYTRFKEYEFRK